MLSRGLAPRASTAWVTSSCSSSVNEIDRERYLSSTAWLMVESNCRSGDGIPGGPASMSVAPLLSVGPPPASPPASPSPVLDASGAGAAPPESVAVVPDPTSMPESAPAAEPAASPPFPRPIVPSPTVQLAAARAKAVQ